MKKSLFILFIGLAAMAMGQETETTELNKIDSKHEVRVDVLESLIAPAIDVSYEYVISKFSGAGISAFVALDDDIGDYQNFAITPYYRQYFFNKKEYGARGFFAEGVVQFAAGDTGDYFYDDITGNYISEDRNWNAFGIGFAIGQKWVSKNGFVAEISAGGGRNFASEDFVPEAFFRGGISFGYRF